MSVGEKREKEISNLTADIQPCRSIHPPTSLDQLKYAVGTATKINIPVKMPL